MIANYPGHKPAKEIVLKKALFAMGATEETLFEYLDILNKQWDEFFASLPGGKMREIGVRRRSLLSLIKYADTFAARHPHLVRRNGAFWAVLP